MITESPRIRSLEAKDFDKLITYLGNLNQETRSRFNPHSFDLSSIQEFYLPQNYNLGYIITTPETKEIIAYAIIKKGYIAKDKTRLENYGVQLYLATDCTFAPSVADAWQSKGLGKLLFKFIREDLQKQGFKRIILWGGVQANNKKAVCYYLKYQFEKIGSFEKNGIDNYDMLLEL